MLKTTKRKNQKLAFPVQKRAKKRAIVTSTRAPGPRATRAKKKVTAALLQEMTRRLVKEFDPEQVILFGSYAWGKPNQDSDVDLMVIVSESDEKETRRMARGLYCLRGLGVSKDVAVKTRADFEFFAQVPASLEAAILRQGKVLYERRKKTLGAKLVHQSTA